MYFAVILDKFWCARNELVLKDKAHSFLQVMIQTQYLVEDTRNSRDESIILIFARKPQRSTKEITK